MSTADILPDSRLRTVHSTRRSVFDKNGVEWIPVFCANCGKEGGLVTTTCTFAFWICGSCEKTHGHITTMMRVPDHEFYEKLKNEQLEMAGRPLTQSEIAQVIAEDATPLAKLIKEAK